MLRNIVTHSTLGRAGPRASGPSLSKCVDSQWIRAPNHNYQSNDFKDVCGFAMFPAQPRSHRLQATEGEGSEAMLVAALRDNRAQRPATPILRNIVIYTTLGRPGARASRPTSSKCVDYQWIRLPPPKHQSNDFKDVCGFTMFLAQPRNEQLQATEG